jgi:hypothetical protein
MPGFERAGQRDTADRTRWLAGMERLMAGWGVDVTEGGVRRCWYGRGATVWECPVRPVPPTGVA